jgi:hypothetical protein
MQCIGAISHSDVVRVLVICSRVRSLLQLQLPPYCCHTRHTPISIDLCSQYLRYAFQAQPSQATLHLSLLSLFMVISTRVWRRTGVDVVYDRVLSKQ